MTPDAHFARLFPRLSRKRTDPSTRKTLMTPEMIRERLERFNHALTESHKARSHVIGVANSALIVIVLQVICVYFSFKFPEQTFEYNGVFWLALAMAAIGIYGIVRSLKLRKTTAAMTRLIEEAQSTEAKDERTEAARVGGVGQQ